MEIVKGQIVFSRAGRDVTHPYMVLDIQGDRLLLADGGKRTLAAPKKKNVRHINPTSTVLPADAAETDQSLRAALMAYIEKAGPNEQGGEKLV